MFKKFAVLLFFMLLAAPVLADEVSTKYISVDLPDNWKAVMPPTENQGVTTVIFSNAAGNSTVNFVTGPNGGADLKTVAETFATQFKSPKPPVEKKRPVHLCLYPAANAGAVMGGRHGRLFYGHHHHRRPQARSGLYQALCKKYGVC